jgi:alpha-glucoside transport system substrate-binding protein
MPWTGRRRFAALLLAGSLLAACASDAPVDRNRLQGTTLVVFGPWSGVEQQRFVAVLAAFSASTGARIRYLSAGDRYMPDVIDARVARGEAPDVALLPQPGLLRHYAAAGRLVPLDADTREVVGEHYPAVWRSLASWHGRQYGVWFKAANKSLVWYDVGAFERAGVVPPDDLAGLQRVATALRRVGVAPFAVAGYDGWTLTDWFENLYLRLAGPARYDALATHRIAWTDPSVGAALAMMGRLLRPRNVLGGAAHALRTSFEESVLDAFGPPTRAAMLAEGDFVAGFVTSGTHRRIGTDVDVFPFPGNYAGFPVVMGGGDVAVQMTGQPAASELLRYLASPRAAEVWAARGGFISPNLDVDLGVYPDGVSRALARQVVEAGSGFRFDLSDVLPADFGSAPWSGMQGALRKFLRDGDVAAAQRRLEAGATRAAGQ